MRADCTDKALDRILSRLADSKFKIDGDKAKLTIQWNDDDGYPNQAFGYSDEDLPFRKIKNNWLIDVLPEAGTQEMVELFKPGSWGAAFRDGMNLLNAAIEDVESGKLKTWQEVSDDLDKSHKVLEKKWPENHHDPIALPREKIQTK